MSLLTLELPSCPQPSSLADIRRSLRLWLCDQRVPEPMVMDLCLVATELVANAREASAGAGPPIEVSCEVVDRAVHLIVRDWGPGESLPTLDSRVVDGCSGDTVSGDTVPVDAVRGRGLSIVRTLTDEVSFERKGSATYVHVVAGFGQLRSAT